MKHIVSRDLHAYWDRLRAGRTAPERGDLDPAAIRHILAYTFVLDVAAARVSRACDVRFRLSGTRVDALFGRDLKGCSFDRLWNCRDAAMADALVDGVLGDRSAVVAAARGGPPGCAPVDLELLLLPLRHHARTHARILGSLAACETPGWMGLTATAPLAITSFRTLGEEDGAGRPAAVAPPGLGSDTWAGSDPGEVGAESPPNDRRSLRRARIPMLRRGWGQPMPPGLDDAATHEDGSWRRGRRPDAAWREEASAGREAATQVGGDDAPAAHRVGRFTVHQGGRQASDRPGIRP